MSLLPLVILPYPAAQNFSANPPNYTTGGENSSPLVVSRILVSIKK